MEKAPTWHEADLGARLVGEQVAMSQLAEITEADAACIWLSLIADQDDAVDLTMELDFMDDGIVDFEHRITETGFARADTQVRAPLHYTGMRVRVRKVGEGDAVIAQVRAQRTSYTDCAGEPLPARGLPLGSECEDAEECAGGSCSETSVLGSDVAAISMVTCGECESDSDCPDGQACGAGWGEGLFPGKVCLEAGSKALGEACTGDTECAAGACVEAQCGECREDADCGGETCAPHAVSGSTPGGLGPWMCPVGERDSGEACLANDDCAAGSCASEGELSICDPNGEPCSADTDCIWEAWGATCETVGLLAGTCL